MAMFLETEREREREGDRSHERKGAKREKGVNRGSR